jgi:AraC-like DNA-binding protein
MDAIEASEWQERAKAARYRVSALASAAGTSPQQLRNFFLHHFHMSPKQWLDQRKLTDALSLLRTGRLIKEIHEQLGFRHPNHLARAFRRISGRNPGACRAFRALRFQRTFKKGLKLSKKVQNIRKRSARILAHRKG